MNYEIKKESHIFSLMIMALYSHLTKNSKEFILSKQLLRSGTSIGANIREAQDGQSKKDFLSKANISLKEAKETVYWLGLLKASGWMNGYRDEQQIIRKAKELARILTKIVRTTKQNLGLK